MIRALKSNVYFLLALYLVVGLLFVFFRPVYSDEGYYIYAARNILHGKLLYADFIYHQFPLLPYIYALFSDSGYFSYYLLRGTSILFTLLLLIVIYHSVKVNSGNVRPALLAVLLVITNAFFVDWNSVIKMYSLANLLLYTCFALITLFKYDSSKKDFMYCFLMGLFSGICINLRIMFTASVLIMLFYLCVKLYKEKRIFKPLINYILFFFSGLLIPSLLTLYYLFYYYEYFIFGNVTVNYYAEQLKWGEGPNALLWLKFFIQPQNFILFFLFFTACANRFRFKYLLILILISLVAVNSFGYFVNEYLTAVIPFLVYAVSANYGELRQKIKIKNKHVLGFLIIFYIVIAPVVLPHFRNKVEGRILEPGLSSFSKIADHERSLPGKTILCSWDIYYLFSGKENILKNAYIYACVEDKPSLSEKKACNIPDKEKIESLIKNKSVDVIVLNKNTPFVLKGLEPIIKENFSLNYTYGNIEIYTK